MKNLTTALLLLVLPLGLSFTAFADTTDETEVSSNSKSVYLISVVTLKGDKVNRSLRKTLKKIAQAATKFKGEALGNFNVEQPQDRKLTLAIRLPDDTKLGRFQRQADAHYVKLRKNVETEYRFVAVASDSALPQRQSNSGSLIKIRDIKGQYPKLEIVLSQE